MVARLARVACALGALWFAGCGGDSEGGTPTDTIPDMAHPAPFDASGDGGGATAMDSAATGGPDGAVDAASRDTTATGDVPADAITSDHQPALADANAAMDAQPQLDTPPAGDTAAPADTAPPVDTTPAMDVRVPTPQPDTAPMCLQTGQQCAGAAGQCCAGSTCVNDLLAGVTVCAAQCTSNAQCTSGCCAMVTGSTVGACGPAQHCQATPPPPPPTCGRLILRANDGQFLGTATSNRFAAESVCNEFGNFGSKFSTTSIYNQFGMYGSQFSTLSAYNQFTTTPPFITCETSGEKRLPVSKNAVLPNRIDPDGLCQALAAAGL